MRQLNKRNLFQKLIRFFFRLINFIRNQMLDIFYLGRPLGFTVKTKFTGQGANDSGFSDYGDLKKIFSYFKIKSDDVLVDVGCAKGRVIGWWLKKGYKNKIIGIELDQNLTRQAESKFAKHKNVSVLNGDILENIPEDGSVFYLFNPFNERIIEKFQQIIFDLFSDRRDITIIYYNCIFVDEFIHSGNWEIEYINLPRGNVKHETALIRLKHNLMNSADTSHADQEISRYSEIVEEYQYFN